MRRSRSGLPKVSSTPIGRTVPGRVRVSDTHGDRHHFNGAMPALLVLLVVTAVWGVTFVQVKDAVAIYPLFAFLALRFAIASGTLAVPGIGRLRALGRRGALAGIFAGALLGAGYALQTAG